MTCWREIIRGTVDPRSRSVAVEQRTFLIEGRVSVGDAPVGWRRRLKDLRPLAARSDGGDLPPGTDVKVCPLDGTADARKMQVSAQLFPLRVVRHTARLIAVGDPQTSGSTQEYASS